MGAPWGLGIGKWFGFWGVGGWRFGLRGVVGGEMVVWWVDEGRDSWWISSWKGFLDLVRSFDFKRISRAQTLYATFLFLACGSQ